MTLYLHTDDLKFHPEAQAHPQLPPGLALVVNTKGVPSFLWLYLNSNNNIREIPRLMLSWELTSNSHYVRRALDGKVWVDVYRKPFPFQGKESYNWHEHYTVDAETDAAFAARVEEWKASPWLCQGLISAQGCPDVGEFQKRIDANLRARGHFLGTLDQYLEFVR